MNFSQALTLIISGKRLARRSWDITRFVYLVGGSTFKVNRAPLLGIYPEGTDISYQPHIDEAYLDGPFRKARVWNPSQDDLFADDWMEVNS